MIGPITPTSPTYFQALRKFKFENVREKFENQQQDNNNNNNSSNGNKTVSIDVSNVRIHCPNKPPTMMSANYHHNNDDNNINDSNERFYSSSINENYQQQSKSSVSRNFLFLFSFI
ncbi:hypothetical protein BLA29_010408 [Euroglyphus maynei]|uniref:Uncharacterized protein n=1 Tax=Euroglyphus maynei TaxID=6958 RepID=A0A1Y3BBY1_EURMA|nr:hypothetical protein BLA29_010408 [Euroglyphus maynei]